MLIIPKVIPMINEAKVTGKGNNLWLEVLKFIVISSVTNLLVLFFSEKIIMMFIINTLANTDLSIFKYLYGNIIGILIIIVYCHYVENRTISSMGLKKSKICIQYVKGAFIGFLLFSCVVFIGVFLKLFTFESRNKNIDIRIVLLFLGGFLLQGMFEEMVFRGYFMISMARKNSLYISVILNSAIFGFMHGFNNGFQIIGFLNLTLFGIFESIYMLRKGNIWGISSIHSIWNFAQGLIYGFSISGIPKIQSIFVFNSIDYNIFNGGSFGPEGSLSATIVLMGAVIISLLYKREI